MANSKGHMISFVTRMFIVTVVGVFVMAAVLVLLLQANKLTWPAVFATIVPGTLAIAINYLYWRPRYKVL